MPRFLVIYKSDPAHLPATLAEQTAGIAAWQTWMRKVGPNLADPGCPVGKSWTVRPGSAAPGGNTPPILGYSILDCDDIETACALMDGNPIVEGGGEVEVSPLMPMPASQEPA